MIDSAVRFPVLQGINLGLDILGFTPVKSKNNGFDPVNKKAVAKPILRVAGAYMGVVAASISITALFIIGCIAAFGVIPGSTLGWMAIGLGGGASALYLSTALFRNFKKRAWEIIPGALIAALMGTVLVTGGILGCRGILSGTQLGWGIIGTSVIGQMAIGAVFIVSLPLAMYQHRAKAKDLWEKNKRAL